MKTVTFVPKVVMEHFTTPQVVISIGDPGEEHPNYKSDMIDVLRIEVHDIPDGIAIEDLDRTYRQFDWHHARNILRFEHRYADHDIIVHCHAGISRSAAVAKYLGDKCGRRLFMKYEGQDSQYNKQIYRQLSITHLDMEQSSNQQVHPLIIGG